MMTVTCVGLLPGSGRGIYQFQTPVIVSGTRRPEQTSTTTAAAAAAAATLLFSMIRSDDSFSFFHDLKKKAISFFNNNIRTARLFFTDVTPAQLLTEEAIISRSPTGFRPDTRTMRIISKAAFEIGDYWRIVDVIHKRLKIFDKRKWNEFYKALALLEYLLTHGPQSVADEFELDIGVIREEAKAFRYIDERGFNWGMTVKKKAERVLKLLEKRQFLKQERERCTKLTRGIQGFGSSSSSSSSHTRRRSLTTALENVDDDSTTATPSQSKEISVQGVDKECFNCNYYEEEEEQVKTVGGGGGGEEEEPPLGPLGERTNCYITLTSSCRRKITTPVKKNLSAQESTPLLSLKKERSSL